MAAPDLDVWLPDAQVTSRHRRTSRAYPTDLWRAAREIRLDETRSLGRLIRWRIPGTPTDLRFTDLFARYPFAVLDEGPTGRSPGSAGRSGRRPATTAASTPAPSATGPAPGTVRVLFGHWVEEAHARSALVSEARVAPTDRFARLQLRALWLIVRRFERVIGSEPLPLAVARAEAVYAMTQASGTITYSRKNSFQTSM